MTVSSLFDLAVQLLLIQKSEGRETISAETISLHILQKYLS